MEINTSSIFIVNDVEQYSQELYSSLPLHSARIIKNEESSETFLKAEATMALKEAYISVSSTKYIILCASNFSVISQNILLKVLEEPPRNIIFIMVTSAKTSILPTIFSRLAYKYLKTKKEIVNCNLNIKNFDLKEMHAFLKENQRISKLELKELIESIMNQVKTSKIKLNEKQLNSFVTSVKLCELNSRPINILTTLLLNLMDKDESI